MKICDVTFGTSVFLAYPTQNADCIFYKEKEYFLILRIKSRIFNQKSHFPTNGGSKIGK